MGLKQKQRQRKPIFCGRCGRITFVDSPDYQWWLVGAQFGTRVNRCPQHITEWTLRTSGMGRSKEAYRWRRLAKEQDQYDELLEAIEPLFVEDDI